jgi:hypothetical protein
MSRVIPGARAAAAALAAAGLLAVGACGTQAPSPPESAAGSSATGPGASSMATSIAGSLDSWAIVPMAASPAFWQVFARAANSAAWKLVTPPGVAINGGIVASADGASALTVAVRPSDDLTFSPLAATANGGASWSSGGPIDAAVAASPGALGAAGNRLVALLSDGTIETSSDAGTTWSVTARPGAIAASPAARGCGGAVRVTSVSFGATGTDVLAGGTCGTGRTTALFSYSPGTGWQRVSLPVSGRLVRFAAGTALVQAKAGLIALFDGGYGWYAYAPLAATPQAVPAGWHASAALPAPGPVTASGALALGGDWVLLSGGRAATISGPGQQWTPLPPVPAKTAVLASGPDEAVDALSVSGATLTVWRLATAATVWSKVQTIKVPIQYGSSS